MPTAAVYRPVTTMFTEILVPTDGSEAADQAIATAIAIADAFDARVHALYAISLQPYYPLEITMDRVVEVLEREGEDAVDRIAHEAAEAGLEHETEIVRGMPHEAIGQYAEAHDIDLIVMATHGRTGLDRTLLGSVTERVLRSSSVPVLAVTVESD